MERVRAYLIRDNGRKFGLGFARVAKTSYIEILKTPYHAPRANAICERASRAVCVVNASITYSSSKRSSSTAYGSAYVKYFNQARPHQGMSQQIPEQRAESVPPDHASGKILSFPILGGLHHDYRRSA
jgi:putative transposase